MGEEDSGCAESLLFGSCNQGEGCPAPPVPLS